MPGAAYIVSNISSIKLLISEFIDLTGSETFLNTGSGSINIFFLPFEILL